MEKQIIKITRQEADNIFQNFYVTRTELKRESSCLKITIFLSNKKQLQINYNPGTMIKSYSIEN